MMAHLVAPWRENVKCELLVFLQNAESAEMPDIGLTTNAFTIYCVSSKPITFSLHKREGGGGGATYLFLGGYVWAKFHKETYKRGKVFQNKTRAKFIIYRFFALKASDLGKTGLEISDSAYKRGTHMHTWPSLAVPPPLIFTLTSPDLVSSSKFSLFAMKILSRYWYKI